MEAEKKKLLMTVRLAVQFALIRSILSEKEKPVVSYKAQREILKIGRSVGRYKADEDAHWAESENEQMTRR